MTRLVNTKKQALWMALSLFLVTTFNAATGEPLLIAAVKAQDKDAARELIERNVDVNEPQLDGATALHWAVHRDDLDTATLLIEAGANVKATNDLGVMPLSLACTNRNTAMTEALLKAGADPNATLLTGETVLMTAAHTGDLDTVDVLLKYGANVNTKEPIRQQTALMWAIGKNHIEIVRKLVKQGADVHAETTLGFTPLFFAVRAGNWEAAKMFLDAGADPSAISKDEYALSVLHIAVHRGHGDVAALLLDRGADPNYDAPGYTALHWAVGTWETELSGINGMTAPKGHEWDSMSGVQEGKFELVKALLDHGANPNALLKKLPHRYGYATKSEPINSTPLTLAASAGEPEIMRLLAKYGADPQHRPDNNLTALMIAAGSRRVKWISRVSESDSIEAIKAAVELGGDINEVDSSGNTALHAAAKLGSLELIQFLVDNGALIDVKNKQGLTPIYDAEHEYTAMTTVKIEGAPAAILLRKLSIQVPDLVQKSINEWSSLSAEVRDTIESLLQKELETLDEKDKP